VGLLGGGLEPISSWQRSRHLSGLPCTDQRASSPPIGWRQINAGPCLAPRKYACLGSARSKIRRAQICVVVVGLCPESLVPGVVVELVGSEPLPELRQPEHIHGVSSTDCASNHIHASGSFLEGSSWWVVKSQTLHVQTIGRLRNIRPPPACSIGGRSGKSIKVATLSRSPLSAASLEPAARSDRRHGRRFLTYQRTVTMSSATRETGTRARGAAGSPPASLWTKRTCCDDQK
jgi:hypothetical protein